MPPEVETAPEINAAEYVSGGYRLARVSKRAEYMSPQLLPDNILSACDCICDFFPDSWAIEWTSEGPQERSNKAAAFGISPDGLPPIIAWATASFSETFGWPNVFYTLEAAEDAHARFLPANSEIVIFGLGLRDNDVGGFVNVAKPPPRA